MSTSRVAKPFFKRKAVQYGLPTVLFVLGGFYGLQRFVETKYEHVDSRVKRQYQREYQLEQEHKAAMQRLNLADFEIKPIPRPPKAADDDD